MQVLSTAGKTVHIPIGAIQLEASLTIPADARGVVVFAHGSGSSRQSPRNRFVAQSLNGRRMATLLVDLMTEEEESVDAYTGGRIRFDIKRLSTRLAAASDWITREKGLAGLPIGYFGASTGAAAALVAAAERPDGIRAVVSRGGRPDLAGGDLARVRAPTLLIVGGADYTVIRLNRDAMQRLRAENHLAVIPGATHLFEEPGALEEVARLAGEWFESHF
jgi:putative phosphoribosyl transferase